MEIGSYTLTLAYQLPDFRDPATILDEVIEDLSIDITQCEPLSLRPALPLTSDYFERTYLRDDPLTMTFSAWLHDTELGQETGSEFACGGTVKTELVQVVELSPNKESEIAVDYSWTLVTEVEETHPALGIQMVP